MAIGKNIMTWFEGSWHRGDVAVMRAADHGAWLGSSVFDGARMFDGLTPDLDKHCARVNRSARAMMLTPTVEDDAMVELVREGLADCPKDQPVYIRPMYWGLDGDHSGIAPKPGSTGFCICLEAVAMAPPDAAATLGTTRFRRPVLEDSVCNAKAGALYPNNARMLAEARSKGFSNALVADALGNVAESATANVFMVRDGVVMTPVANGTFLSGITRARHIKNLRADGMEVVETVLTFDDFRAADEVFLSGNMNKVTPVTAFEDRSYQIGPVTRRARELYWDWAASER
ncbi:branched-chain amino acid aminotransferase [Frigidibacter sp. ROC022]|uniref:branched-chain amino acid aminotransferase n=1 Tax=Frigidibacter sp. ROC022 TaxID=2971796 RepID=UPI00215B1AAE|nr:branched-chain amino acid aminotransferase [Frigidibacter sp. ROC022]MCR8725977.1 branched-chain amino acid aminotransferase [Frigidibacter sp. ROC022]